MRTRERATPGHEAPPHIPPHTRGECFFAESVAASEQDGSEGLGLSRTVATLDSRNQYPIGPRANPTRGLSGFLKIFLERIP